MYFAGEYDVDNLDPFFTEPENSKHFQIAYLHRLHEPKHVQVKSSQFLNKAVMLPYSDGYIIFSLLHTIEK